MKMLLVVVAVGLCSMLSAGAAVTRGATGPLAFEPNRGQWPKAASYGAHAPGFLALFGSTGADVSYVLNSSTGVSSRVTMHWVSASPQEEEPESNSPLAGTVNYYGGGDSSRWIAGVPTFGRLVTKQLYPGIDLVYYGNGKTLEYDLLVGAGANPKQIRFRLEGGRPHINADGDLLIEANGGVLLQRRPTAYQELNGKKIPVSSRFALNARDEVTLTIGKYDRRAPLVVDPTVAWVRAFGASQMGITNSSGIALDASGNIYITGYTSAPDLLTVNAAQPVTGRNTDAFVTKFAPDGTTVLWSTYYGGTGDDFSYGIAVDATGNAYITGMTTSLDLPLKNAYQTTLHSALGNALVAKFSPTGSLLYSTYLGGGRKDTATSIAIDGAGNMYLGGNTTSTDFPLASTYQAVPAHGFVTKILASGSVLGFSSYLGDSSTSVSSIAVGPDGGLYATGSTRTPPSTFPLVNPSLSKVVGTGAFLTRFSPSGTSLIYSTLFGGSGCFFGCKTNGVALAVDSTGAAYLTGDTDGAFPLKNANQITTGGTFLTKFSPDGQSLVYSTGWGAGAGKALAIDAQNRVVIAGGTYGTEFQLIGAFQSVPEPADGVVATFDEAGTATFSSYLGGNGSDAVKGVAVDNNGNTFLVGDTTSTDSPVASASQNNGDVFVMKLTSVTQTVPVTFSTVPPGLSVTLDGTTVATPATLSWVVGTTHQLDVPLPQAINSGLVASNFLSWSSGGAKAQAVHFTASSPTAYTANLNSQICVYGFEPPLSVTFGQAGGTTLLHSTQPSGCYITPTTNADWIHFSPAVYTVDANPRGGTRTGTIFYGGASLTVIQTDVAPTVYLGLPHSSFGGSQVTLNLTSTDGDGISDLGVTNLLINDAIDGRRACYIAYDHPGNTLYLVDDAGVNLLPGATFDAQGRLSAALGNGQCLIDPIGSSISRSRSSTDVALTLAISFRSSFSGNHVMYTATRDKEANNTGWITSALWNVPSPTTTFPLVNANVSLSSSLNELVVEATFDDASSSANLTPSQILINGSLDGRHACYMGYDHQNGILFLVNDAGDALLPGIRLGQANTQSNSQCTINGISSYAQDRGDHYILLINLTYASTFTGTKIVYGATQTTSGGNSGWQSLRLVNLP